MILWWLTFSLACKPVAKMIVRVLLCVAGLTPKVTPPPSPSTVVESSLTQQTTSTIAPLTSELIPGVYDYESSLNFDNYLTELGVSYVLRKLAGLAYPTVRISKVCQEVRNLSEFYRKPDLIWFFQDDSCQWKIRTETVFRSHEVLFKLNERANDVTMDGRSVQFVIRQFKSNQWVETQESGDKVTTITRDFEDDQMKVSLIVNDVSSMSIFRRRIEEDDPF